ncbi:uncharacterized protein A1O9_08141 [Exophiala aquamarina CBS 119918]|uniref:Uncharacterized protein n=1 Tax=Exophiala aquamarina CBS 119918 TaxID=1182545 RepID=A0A072P6B3_9EURO|nr:uncharacterized protein A1O9_08141 [Exophiala aquamarina CBS 119918]KEF55391.1 hypothetical protein A1O9_08141 [Exophiala aquamarina CBS 119918]
MEGVRACGLASPPVSVGSPSPSNASNLNHNSSLPAPRMHRLRPGSQKEIALINYLDDKILRITRRYAKKFSNESRDKDNTPGYTTYDEFATDVEPLVNVVWISGTPGQVCSYLQAFPFSNTFFALVGKIDEGFASLLQPLSNGNQGDSPPYHVSTTDKVRIKSLVEETRVAAMNAASASGHVASVEDSSEIDTEDDRFDDDAPVQSDEEERSDAWVIPLKLSRVYKRTLEILGDSLVRGSLPRNQSSGSQCP